MNTPKTKTKSKRVPVGLYLDEEEIIALKEAAAREGRSLSNYVRNIFFAQGCITTQEKEAAK